MKNKKLIIALTTLTLCCNIVRLGIEIVQHTEKIRAIKNAETKEEN